MVNYNDECGEALASLLDTNSPAYVEPTYGLKFSQLPQRSPPANIRALAFEDCTVFVNDVELFLLPQGNHLL